MKVALDETLKTGLNEMPKNIFQIFRKTCLKPSFGVFLVLFLTSTNFLAQESKDTADKALKGSGRVNPTTLAMEIDIPLGSYPGRGINVPISLSYSSKLWRMDTVEMLSTSLGGAGCKTYSYPIYGEDTKSGWTTSLDVPVIEYTGWMNRFTSEGFPVIDRFCEHAPPPPESGPVARITIRLPSGQTHELRKVNPFAGPEGTTGYYYAPDGSQLDLL